MTIQESTEPHSLQADDAARAAFSKMVMPIDGREVGPFTYYLEARRELLRELRSHLLRHNPPQLTLEEFERLWPA